MMLAGLFLFPTSAGFCRTSFVVTPNFVVGLFCWAVDVRVELLGVEVVELCDWFCGLAIATVLLVFRVLGAKYLHAIACVLAVVKYTAFGDFDVFKRAAF